MLWCSLAYSYDVIVGSSCMVGGKSCNRPSAYCSGGHTLHLLTSGSGDNGGSSSTVVVASAFLLHGGYQLYQYCTSWCYRRLATGIEELLEKYFFHRLFGAICLLKYILLMKEHI